MSGRRYITLYYMNVNITGQIMIKMNITLSNVVNLVNHIVLMIHRDGTKSLSNFPKHV